MLLNDPSVQVSGQLPDLKLTQGQMLESQHLFAVQNTCTIRIGEIISLTILLFGTV